MIQPPRRALDPAGAGGRAVGRGLIQDMFLRKALPVHHPVGEAGEGTRELGWGMYQSQMQFGVAGSEGKGE